MLTITNQGNIVIHVLPTKLRMVKEVTRGLGTFVLSAANYIQVHRILKLIVEGHVRHICKRNILKMLDR